MTRLVLALLIPAALIGGFAYGVLSRAIEIRLKALHKWSQPNIITRAMADAWDEGYNANHEHVRAGLWGDLKPLPENPYRTLLRGGKR